MIWHASPAVTQGESLDVRTFLADWRVRAAVTPLADLLAGGGSEWVRPKATILLRLPAAPSVKRRERRVPDAHSLPRKRRPRLPC